jgi:predicted RNase H-like HicB family nuclease
MSCECDTVRETLAEALRAALRVVDPPPPPRPPEPRKFACSFCRKSAKQVHKLITAERWPRVCICNECIELCVEIIEEEDQMPDPKHITQRPSHDRESLDF